MNYIPKHRINLHEFKHIQCYKKNQNPRNLLMHLLNDSAEMFIFKVKYECLDNVSKRSRDFYWGKLLGSSLPANGGLSDKCGLCCLSTENIREKDKNLSVYSSLGYKKVMGQKVNQRNAFVEFSGVFWVFLLLPHTLRWVGRLLQTP